MASFSCSRATAAAFSASMASLSLRRSSMLLSAASCLARHWASSRVMRS
jgi:hypothetical protein